MEWSNPNKYNSFNSYKGLTYYENYKKIVGWFEGKNELPPPIEASLDPVSACNNSCYYCNSKRYLREEPAHLKRWGQDYMMDLLSDLCGWGVRGVCWGGGGESTLNIRLPEMNRIANKMGMETAIITNGVNMSDDLIDSLSQCRWIGISLDSANPEVYKKVRGTDDCLKVLENIKKLVAKKGKADIGVKVLVLPETLPSLYYTCKTMKDLGIQDFHVRPVDLERKDNKNPQRLSMDMELVQRAFDKCHSIEDKDFHVYTVTHKYDENFHVKHDFNKCYASPLVTQICTDKQRYVCVDHRLEPEFLVEEWGSDEHRQLLMDIVPDRDCGRCTFGEYNRQCEEVVIKDRMCVNFP